MISSLQDSVPAAGKRTTIRRAEVLEVFNRVEVPVSVEACDALERRPWFASERRRGKLAYLWVSTESREMADCSTGEGKTPWRVCVGSQKVVAEGSPVLAFDMTDDELQAARHFAKELRMSLAAVVRAFLHDEAEKARDEEADEERERRGKIEWSDYVAKLPLLDRELVIRSEQPGAGFDLNEGFRLQRIKERKAIEIYPDPSRGARPFKMFRAKGKAECVVFIPSWVKSLYSASDVRVSATGIVRAMTVLGDDHLLRPDIEEAWFGMGRSYGMLWQVSCFKGRAWEPISISIPWTLWLTVKAAAEAVGTTPDRWIATCYTSFRVDPRGGCGDIMWSRREAKLSLGELKKGEKDRAL